MTKRLLRVPLMSIWRISSPIIAIVFFISAKPAWSADVPTVVASADMALALKEIGSNFTRQTTQKLNLTFGATDPLMEKINEGSPVDLFLSADEASIASLRQHGKAADDGIIYGIGRIALFAPRKKKNHLPLRSLSELKDAIERGKITRVVIPAPERCPYGRAAREALQNADVWSVLADKLIIADDAAQAAKLVFTGKADAAILPLALVISPLAKSRGAFSIVDVKAHHSLKQRMVLMTGAGSSAKAFYNYMQAPVAREVLRRYGYTFPMQ